LLGSNDLELTDEERELVISRVRKMASALESVPKSAAWKMRDLIGTRVRWYAEVEEVDQ